MFGSASATVTTTPLDVHVHADEGNDRAPGLAHAPLRSIEEALRRTPDLCKHLLRVWVHPSATPVAMPDFAPRVYGRNLWVIGGTGPDDLFAFTEVEPPAFAQTGSNSKQLVTTGGLTPNAYRGLFLQILSGPRAGDLRLIRDNDDATIVPTNAFGFGDAIDSGDQYRIVDSVVRVVLPDSWRVDVASFGERAGGGSSTTRPHGPSFANLRFGVEEGASFCPISVNPAAFYGCKFETVSWSGSTFYVGNDDEIGTSGIGAAMAEEDLGLPSHSLRGWGVVDEPQVHMAAAHASIGGLVTPKMGIYGSRVKIEGLSCYEGGANIASSMVSITGDKPAPGDVAAIIRRVGQGDGPLGFNAALLARSLRTQSQPGFVGLGGAITIESDNIGVLASYGGHVHTFAAEVVSDDVGYQAELGGQINLNANFLIVTAPTELRILDDQTPIDRSLGDIPSDGNYFDAANGSVIRRIDL